LIEIVKFGLIFVKYLKTPAVVFKNLIQLENLDTSGKVNDGFKMVVGFTNSLSLSSDLSGLRAILPNG